MLLTKNKHLKHWALLFAIVLTSASCALPSPPKGEFCLIWAETRSCECVDSESGEYTRSLSLDECHKYIAVSPDFQQKIDAYIQELRQLARKRCR